MSSFERVIDCCTKALEIDEKYIKCYFRRSKAYENLENFEESLKGNFMKFFFFDKN